MLINKLKEKEMEKLSNENYVLSALAIDQRPLLEKMFADLKGEAYTKEEIERFKVLVSEELTPHASSILLDPQYGLKAATARDTQAGLLLAYEEAGYAPTDLNRMPSLSNDLSVKELKRNGANGIKFLLFYNIDDKPEVNLEKQRFIERLGSECDGENLPFFLEVLSYDANVTDMNSREYAKLKPKKVNEMIKEFSKEQYGVDVLKVEVPVNMNWVEGYGNQDFVHTKEEAKRIFLDQDQATALPFIFLSAGVSAELFVETLLLAKEAGSTFNGVLCGRATWADAVKVFVEDGEYATRQWLQTTGVKNITALNETLASSATPWK